MTNSDNTMVPLNAKGRLLFTDKRSVTNRPPRLSKSLDLQMSSLAGYSKKENAFLVYAICFHKTVHVNGRQIENGFFFLLAKRRLRWLDTVF